MTRAIVLGAYAAKQCPRRVHNDWDATVDAVPWEPPPELQMLFEAGQEFERTLVEELVGRMGPDRCVDLTGVNGKAETTRRTLEAMDDGVDLVVGGRLPDDEAGGRTGRPDLLIRHTGTSYVPGDIKAHRTARSSARGTLTYSLTPDVADTSEIAGLAPESRLDDCLQLAHYWRMLEALGRTPPGLAPTGALIGTDRLDDLGDGPVLVWHDLTDPRYKTFSRSEGTKKRSAMERYDHEHAFRREVAAVAAARTGSEDDPEPLVRPVFIEECDACPWSDYCREVAGPDAASAHVTSGRLTVREWLALERLGVSTVDDLAALDTDEPSFREQYLPEVSHVSKPLDRLGAAIRRARMALAGTLLERTTSGPVDVPRAKVEVDFDIEWDVDNRVYLWGCLVRGADGSLTYRPTVSWEPLDEDAERRLAEEFVTWLRELVDQADGDLLVYHYSHPEPTYLKRILGEDAVGDLLDRFVDLLAVVREHYFGREGLGVKKVAQAFGFSWRDEDPGGLQSQVWLQQARDTADLETADEARERILAYNEDDTRATLVVREHLGDVT